MSNIIYPKLECIHPYKNRWIIRWNFHEEEGATIDFNFKEFIGKPSLDNIKKTILDWYNQQTDQKILSGFTWKDYPVWLSTENQFNYKAAHDLAVMTNGASLSDPENPVVFKFGTDAEPFYYRFEELADIQDFYIKSVSYVARTLKEGWNVKEAINWEEYQ